MTEERFSVETPDQLRELCGMIEEPKDIRDHYIFFGKPKAKENWPIVEIPTTYTVTPGGRKIVVAKEIIVLKGDLPLAEIPRIIDYTSQMSEVMNQSNRGRGHKGTCVACALVDGMREWQERKEAPETISLKDIQLCVNWLYEECKKQDGYPNVQGTYPRVALKIMDKNGVPPEWIWPYESTSEIPERPDWEIKKYATKLKINGYAQVDYTKIEEIKQALAWHGPFCIGVPVYWSWTKEAAKTGIVPMPRPNDTKLGLHLICICGFNDDTQLIKFKNSWGKGWGDKGYGYLPYDYITQLTSSAWVGYDRPTNFDEVPFKKISLWKAFLEYLKHSWKK